MPRSLQLMTHTALAAPHAPRLKKSPTRPDIRSTAGFKNCPRNIKCSAVNPKTKHPFMVILKILHYRLHHSISYNIRNPLASCGVARRNAAASRCCDTSGYRLIPWWTILHDCMLQIVIGYRCIPHHSTKSSNRDDPETKSAIWHGGPRGLGVPIWGNPRYATGSGCVPNISCCFSEPLAVALALAHPWTHPGDVCKCSHLDLRHDMWRGDQTVNCLEAQDRHKIDTR